MTRDNPLLLAIVGAGLCALFAGVGLFAGYAVWGDRDAERAPASMEAAVAAQPATERERCEAAYADWLAAHDRHAAKSVYDYARAMIPHDHRLRAQVCNRYIAWEADHLEHGLFYPYWRGKVPDGSLRLDGSPVEQVGLDE